MSDSNQEPKRVFLVVSPDDFSSVSLHFLQKKIEEMKESGIQIEIQGESPPTLTPQELKFAEDPFSNMFLDSKAQRVNEITETRQQRKFREHQNKKKTRTWREK